ncbi:MAG TPA: hypothetical protein VM491_09535, partial [Burkholderiaceae bacterium]|nr:hypothetical protein [Burkholderiaceae bacterium]
MIRIIDGLLVMNIGDRGRESPQLYQSAGDLGAADRDGKAATAESLRRMMSEPRRRRNRGAGAGKGVDAGSRVRTKCVLHRCESDQAHGD